ncbi:hypothetical protein Tco_1254785 [Tanacetum coccineum]
MILCKVSFDVDDVLGVLSLDSKFNAKKVMCGLMYRRGSPDDGNVVLCIMGLMVQYGVSIGLDMAYLRFGVDMAYPYLQFQVNLVLVIKTKP